MAILDEYRMMFKFYEHVLLFLLRIIYEFSSDEV